MAPGQVITASLAGAVGARAAPYARAFAPGSTEGMKTAVVAGSGLALAAGGVVVHNANKGSGYVGPAMVGAGLGLALGAACDHMGW